LRVGGYGTAAYQAAHGDFAKAAKTTAGTATAQYLIPKIPERLAALTAPLGGSSRDALGRFARGQGGLLTRTAGALSRAAGPLGVAAETLFGPGAAGHCPYGETPERTAERQADFKRQYAELVRRKRLRAK